MICSGATPPGLWACLGQERLIDEKIEMVGWSEESGINAWRLISARTAKNLLYVGFLEFV
jgi:hypothetical protein